MNFPHTKQVLLTAIGLLAFASVSYAQTQDSTQITKGKLNIEKDQRIDMLLQAKKDMFSNNEATLYRIQIYNGTLKEANETLKSFREIFPDWKADISFELPNYKVRVGRFRTRLEADRKLMEIKKEYPNAFLLEPR